MPDVRFTPQEIKELVDAGELKLSDLPRMHKDDAKVAFSMMSDEQKRDDPGFMQGIMTSTPGVTSSIAGAKGGMGMAKAAWSSAAPILGGVAGGAAGNAVGHPVAGWMIGSALGSKLGGGGKGGGKPYNKAPKGVEPYMPNKSAAPGQTGIPSEPLPASPVDRYMPNKSTVQKAPPTSDPVAVGDNVHRGVTNDWGKGKAVSIRKPSNVDDRMPVGSKADYDGWSAAQDAKFPPQDTSIDDLVKRLLAPLQRDKRK